MDDKTSHVQASVTLGADPIPDEGVLVSLRRDLLGVSGIKKLEAVSSTRRHDGLSTTKSSTALGIVGLTVTMAPFALKQAVTVIQMWLDRQKARTVTIEIGGEKLELTASVAADQRAALDLFLQRHAPGPEDSPQGTAPTGTE
ncbi:hypothetical protein [Streptomyces phaeochromogenes]